MRILKSLCCICVLAAALSAQSFLSSITGKVTDPSGGAIYNAGVVATETGTGIVRRTASNASGEYLLADLPPGRYVIAITAPGFKALKSGEVVLTRNQVHRLDGGLEVGAPTESVEVQAAAP